MFAGLIVAVIGGSLIEQMHMEPYAEDFIRSASAVDIDSPALCRRERLPYVRNQTASTCRKVLPYVLIGVGIGAVIHNWLPER